jgi:diguanylate cyclase (GGDEF)-like protein/PAS domain S-box-containing protein
VVLAEWPPPADVRRLLGSADPPALVAVVGTASPGLAERALDGGAADVLLVPARTAEVALRVSAALRRRRALPAPAPAGDMMESLPSGAALLGPDGRIARANAVLGSLAGTEPARLAGLRVGVDPLLGPDPGRVVALFRASRARGSATAELELSGGTGTPRPVSVALSTLRDDLGTVSGYVMTVRDASDPERAQGALRRIIGAADLGPRAVLHRLAGEAADLVGARAAAVIRLGAGGPSVDARHGDGVTAEGVPLPGGEDAAVAAALAGAVGTLGDGVPVSVPLVSGGRAWGRLAVAVRAATAEETRLRLARFADVAAMAAAGIAAAAPPADAAARDPLTGLATHAAFFDRVASAVAEGTARRCPLAVAIVDIDGLKAVNDHHGHAAGDLAVAEVARRIAAHAGPRDTVARIGGEEFGWLMPGTDGAAAADRIRRVRREVAERPVDGAGTVTASLGTAWLDGGPTGPDAAADLVRQAEVALDWAKISGRNRCAAYSFEIAEEVFARRQAMPAEAPSLRAMRALAWAVDARDPHTHRHSARVADLAVMIATVLGWPPERLSQLREAGLVHDVGKIAVPDAILFKPGRLTDREFAVVREHPATGARIVADVLSAEQAAWVRAHHERWDGRGYPDGLAGDAIPEESRVLAVADSWDVIVSERSYKRAVRFDEAIDEMRRCSGGQFWPAAVDALCTLATAGALPAPAGPPGDAAPAPEAATAVTPGGSPTRRRARASARGA